MPDYNKYSDKELLPLLREKSPLCDTAFYVLYHRYSSKINAYCCFKLNNPREAEDIFQETWIRFDKFVKDGKSVENIPAFLITIARNLCIDYFRNNKITKKNISEIEISENEAIDMDFNIQKSMEKAELISLLELAITQLDDIYREAFTLRKLDELSYAEISMVCGESVECIKKRVTRAFMKIKEILKPYINELSQ